MFPSCQCCLLSGRGLCDELITLPGEIYRLWCVRCVRSMNLRNEVAKARVGQHRHRKKEYLNRRDFLKNRPFSPLSNLNSLKWKESEIMLHKYHHCTLYSNHAMWQVSSSLYKVNCPVFCSTFLSQTRLD
jgi:hypothetical protein